MVAGCSASRNKLPDASKSSQPVAPKWWSAGAQSSWTAGRCGTAFKGKTAAVSPAAPRRRKSHWACAAQAGLTSQAPVHVFLQSGPRRQQDWQQPPPPTLAPPVISDNRRAEPCHHGEPLKFTPSEKLVNFLPPRRRVSRLALQFGAVRGGKIFTFCT